MKTKGAIIWLVIILLGIINAVVLYLFELITIEGTEWLWDDVLHTDTYRWLVVPVAIVLSLILTFAFRLLKTKRIIKSSGDLLEEINESPGTLSSIAVILTIGAISLLAGASLGPEASLMAFSGGIAIYFATKANLGPAKQILILSSVGALLVAFFSSYLLVLIPLLLLFQQAKKNGQSVSAKSVGLILLSGFASWIVIESIKAFASTPHYEVLPELPSFAQHDFAVALGMGFVAAFLALIINGLTKWFNVVALKYDALKIRGKDWWFGGAAGLVLGLLYLFGGQTVQFSGKIGSTMLMEGTFQYGAAALITLAFIKIAATAWSHGTGYRGGLVFPSVYVGVAFGLFFGQLFPELGGSGALVGAISGIMTSVIGSPIMAAIFLVAALPYDLWLVAAFAIAGTMVAEVIIKSISKRRLVRT